MLQLFCPSVNRYAFVNETNKASFTWATVNALLMEIMPEIATKFAPKDYREIANFFLSGGQGC
jgi:hypothetical protein